MNDPLVDRDYFVKADAFVDGKERRKKKKGKKKRIERQNWSLMVTCIPRDTPRGTLRPNKASAVHLENNLASLPT